MSTILSYITSGWMFIINQLTSIRWYDIIDILLVTILFYYVYGFIRERRASKLAFGVVLLVAVLFISNILRLSALSFILENIVQIGVIALVIIFQPELRSMLENFGGRNFKSIFNLSEKPNEEIMKFEEEICDAVVDMSSTKTGALIVLEGLTKLGDVTSTGTQINADTSSMLLRNIFFNKSPLHDGAVVIHDLRIKAAGCVLPLTQNKHLDRSLGTRHRAAIGISEQSDCFVIVVSEETGQISICRKGKITRDYDAVTLRVEMEKFFKEDSTIQKIKKRVGKRSETIDQTEKEDAKDEQ